jgi:hypothetical protein
MIRFGTLGLLPSKEGWTGGLEIRKVCSFPLNNFL